jgi:hypothetical protein
VTKDQFLSWHHCLPAFFLFTASSTPTTTTTTTNLHPLTTKTRIDLLPCDNPNATVAAQ